MSRLAPVLNIMSLSVPKNHHYAVNKFIFVINQEKVTIHFNGIPFFTRENVTSWWQYKFRIIPLKLKKLKCFLYPSIILPKTNQTKATSKTKMNATIDQAKKTITLSPLVLSYMKNMINIPGKEVLLTKSITKIVE